MSSRTPSTTNSSAVRIVLEGYTRLKRVKSRVTAGIGSAGGPSVTPRRSTTETPPEADRVDEASTSATPADSRDVESIDLTRLEPDARIMTALEREGGWMWQTEVVDEVDLSSSTVSRHLSSLEEDDEIQRVRIRREKVVGLPDSDLEVFQSPYESDR